MADHETTARTLIAFDFGTKRIGVAVGQTITGTANPLEALNAVNGIPNWSTVESLIKTWRPDAIVVGIPYNMDGSEQPITAKAHEFISSLEQKLKLPIFGVDERLTTVEAKQKLYDLGGYKALKDISIDSFAAKIILENFMRTKQHDNY